VAAVPEYRIVTKIDPAGAVSGSQKVKQELRSVEATANKAKAAVASVGGSTKAVDAQEVSLSKLNEAMRGLQDMHRRGAIEGGRFEVMQQRLRDRITQTTAALEVSRRATATSQADITSLGNAIATGAVPQLRALKDESEASGKSMAGSLGPAGTAGLAAGYIGGLWGVAITTGIALLTEFAMKHLDSRDAIEKAVDALRKDAEQADATERAKAIYSRTLEGNTEAIRLNSKALEDIADAGKTAARIALENAIAENINAKAIRDTTAARLLDLKALQEYARMRASRGGPQGEAAALGLTGRDEAIERIQTELAKADANIQDSQRNIDEALSRRVVERTEQHATALGRIQEKYEGPRGLIEMTRRAATAEEVRNGTLARQITLLREKQALEEKNARDADNKAPSDGVARFRTREQAIGMAGRELQGMGLRVDGNTQFGYTGGHANNAYHNRYKLDANVGKGVVEADIPDLREKFDRIARMYQARGFKVIWNKQVYHPFGNGPGGPAAGHENHIDIEAPATIVGRPTMASTAAQERREWADEDRAQKAAASLADRKRDFVGAIEDRAKQAGAPNDRASALQANIERALADYTRQFNEVASPEQRKRITDALTAADANEIAQHFTDAYVTPLENLQLHQDETALTRAILNRQIEESIRLGRLLSPEEAQLISNSVRQNKAIGEQTAILDDVRAPLEHYQAQLAALNKLLDRGAISQTTFNARVSALGAGARDVLRDMPGTDPNSGQAYSDIAAAGDENARYMAELAQYETYRQQLLQMGINYDALLEAAHRRHADNLNQIDMARRQVALTAAASIADSLLSIAENAAGKQSQLYRTMFAISKAFAIAQASIALYQNVAEAMKYGFPQNLPFIAAAFAQGATIVSAISGLSAGFEKGGYTGDVGRSTPAGTVHGQEFVVNADATARNRSLLEAINAGRSVSPARGVSNDNSRGPIRVTFQNYAPGVEYETQRGVSEDEVVVIARRVARAEAPKAVAADMASPNGRTSKALKSRFHAPPKRA
jgi:hypothetical protein